MIDLIFNELKQLGAVRSRTQFSREWLGREDSYMRGLQSKHRQPSARVIATCAINLRRASETLTESEGPKVRAVGLRLQQLAAQCVDEILFTSIKPC